MKGLIAIPHVFSPREGSAYSSQDASKRDTKQGALLRSCLENLGRHGCKHWIHASLGKGAQVVNRRAVCNNGIELKVQLYTVADQSLAFSLPRMDGLEVIVTEVDNIADLPSYVSRAALSQASEYDIVCYIEDDILIEDADLFHKVEWMVNNTSTDYVFMPHRCEVMADRTDVILSGDPDGGRPDLFWDTGEVVEINWPTGYRQFYRATNPHSGCFFLTKMQAQKAYSYWESKNWIPDYVLGGPLEQAASGVLLPIFKVMKPVPADYRFLMVRHQDELWRRHMFESPLGGA